MELITEQYQLLNGLEAGDSDWCFNDLRSLFDESNSWLEAGH